MVSIRRDKKVIHTTNHLSSYVICQADSTEYFINVLSIDWPNRLLETLSDMRVMVALVNTYNQSDELNTLEQ